MAKNKIQDLRNHLFEVIELLKDGDVPDFTIEKAKAIADVAQVIVNTAKLEIDFIRATVDSNGIFPSTGFIEPEPKPNQLSK